MSVSFQFSKFPLFLIAWAISLSVAADEKKKYSRIDEANLIEPVAATLLGGSGTEWLAGGGFTPDGGLLLVGNAIGPEFSLPNTEVRILGTDTEPPKAQDWPIQLDGKGRPRKTRDGDIKLDKFNYKNPAATPFVIRLAPDLKTIVSASRFPWASGSVTGAATDREGRLYIAGHGNLDLLRETTGDAKAITPPDVEPARHPPPLRTSFLARFDASLSRVEWIRSCTANQKTPRVELLPNGQLLFKHLAFDTFDKDGNIKARTTHPKGLNAYHFDLNPATGEYVYGNEHHWPTGREPWRCPTILIHNPDSSVKMHLYDWPGPVVGSDASRLVSDSAIRNIRYTPDGNLLYSAWSDGGNSCMYRQPGNLYERAWDQKEAGLRLSAAGANAMSFAYVLKMDTESYTISRGTLWVSQYKGVDSARINHLAMTADGSVALAGAVSGHLYQTPNAFEAGDQRGGANLTILNPDLDGIRFSSYMPGCGSVDLGNQAQFIWIQGKAGDRELLAAVTGAKPHEHVPLLNPAQSQHGGGHLDGHLVVFELPSK